MRIFSGRRYRTFRIGDREIRLRTPGNLGEIADLDEPVPAGISQDAFPLFGIVWPSAEILARLMLGYELAGRRILEMGCGMALPSHLLNSLGADITAMDIHPMAGDFLARNAALNKAREIPFVAASWSEALPELGKFDLVIGSDLLYEPIHVRTLAPFLDRHAGPGSEVIIVDPARGHLEEFLQAMKRYGFSGETLPGPDSDIAYEGVVVRCLR